MIRAESCRLFDVFFFFKQKTAYEMRISDWSSDVCSSDLAASGTVPAKGAVPEPMPDGRSATLVRGLGGVDQVGADVALELGPHRLHGLDPGGALLGSELADLGAVVEDLLAASNVQAGRERVALGGLFLDDRRELIAPVIRQGIPEPPRGHHQVSDHAVVAPGDALLPPVELLRVDVRP